MVRRDDVNIKRYIRIVYGDICDGEWRIWCHVVAVSVL